MMCWARRAVSRGGLFDVLAVAVVIYGVARVLSSASMGHWRQLGGRVGYVVVIVAVNGVRLWLRPDC
jgi:hypothetical protein